MFEELISSYITAKINTLLGKVVITEVLVQLSLFLS